MVPQNFIDIFLIIILIVKVFIIIELNRMKVFQFDYNSHNMVFGQLTPEVNCPPLRVGVWVKVRASVRVGGQPDICPRGKLPPG